MTLERENLERTFAEISSDRLQAGFIEPPATPTRLEEHLRQGYHALHFVGHGALNSKEERFALYMHMKA